MPSVNTLEKGYRDLPICDSHVHITYPMPLDRTAAMLRGYMDYFGLTRIALLGLPHSVRASMTDPSNNLKCLYLKSLLNTDRGERRVHAFGGLYHFFDGRDTAQGFLRQAKDLHAMGFDGVKILLGKPELRRRLGVPLDDALFDPFYSFCEAARFPVTMHLGDPEAFWLPGDDGHEPYYDRSFPTLSALRRETEGILEKHPALDLVLCHFYFIADDCEAAERFLTAHPTVSFDLTPGSEMYAGFTKHPDEWRDFFRRHRRRILFGTDTDNWAAPDTDEGYAHNFSYPFNLVRNALESPVPFRFEDADCGLLAPLHADDETLSSIYSENFIRRMGEPRPIDDSLASLAASALLTLREHDVLFTGDRERRETDLENLRVIAEHFRVRTNRTI
ncbi:MAG: amidohydrolase family protein [Clostridia bacterium]|nr:amidohydrolase family protein [Clostridia bacterium]